MTKRFPMIYIPIEVRSREFDGKALLAAMLAKRGYGVVIGSQWQLLNNLDCVPAGTLFVKSFNSYFHNPMRVAKDLGYRVLVLEEELLAHTEKSAIKNFCSTGIFDLPDVILANSQFEKETLTEFSGGRVKIEVAGNPRVEIIKPAYQEFFTPDVEALRARFGDFVLINTNFAVVNTHWASLQEVTDIHVKAGFVNLDDPASVQAWEDQIEFETLNKAAILTAIRELCRRRPDQKIVLRPHPGEAVSRWDGVFADLPNVSVVKEGAHVPWTLACQMLLHTSCTTGFEAYVAGKAALSLTAKPNWISQSFISNRLNPFFTDPIKLVDAAQAYLETGQLTTEGQLSRADAVRFVSNIGEKDGLQRTLGLLTDDLPKPRGKMPPPVLQRHVVASKEATKFSMSLQEFGEIIQRMTGVIGRKPELAGTQIGEGLFYLNRAHDA